MMQALPMSSLLVLCILLSSSAALLAQRANSAIPPEFRTRIEKQVRQYAEAPPDAEVKLGEPKASAAFIGYYTLPVIIRGKQGDRTFEFLLARDFKRLIYHKTFDLT